LGAGHAAWPPVRGKESPEVDEPADGLQAELFALAARAAATSGVAGASPAGLGPAYRSRAVTIRRALMIADLFGLTLAFALVQGFVTVFEDQDLQITAMFVAALPAWLVAAHAYGLYGNDEAGPGRSVVDDFAGIILLSTLTTWLGLLAVNIAHLAHPKLQVATTFWVGAIALITTSRAVCRTVVSHAVEARERTVVVGTGQVAQRIVEKLKTRPELGLDVIGFMDDEPLELPERSPVYLGQLDRLEPLVQAHGVERVIVGFSKQPATTQVELLRRCAEVGVRVDIVPRLFEVLGSRSTLHTIGGIPLISVKAPQLSRTARVMKRALDLSLALVGLILCAPFFAFAAARIKLESPGPVFFRQERMGSGGQTFRIFKFRSMSTDAEERKDEVSNLNMHQEEGPRMFKAPQDPRVTSFGRFMRRWSLDELPQLFNVVVGDMSLVGPRPLVLGEDENIQGHRRRRLHIKPGLTGLWQVLGRSDIPFSEMVTLDYIYVTNWSLWGDVKLLVRTIPVVLRGNGAY
jgi:exopolysaccharide biosynthesis polyprenyl glycosylphosphotransferase